MNIDDVIVDETTIPPSQDILPAIFEHQHQLALKYVEIERKNGFYKPDIESPPGIDDPQFQNWIKNMFWRITEELAEATEDLVDLTGNWTKRWENDAKLRHFFEEITDALHFLVEVSYVVGISPNLVIDSIRSEPGQVMHPFERNARGDCIAGIENGCWRIVHQLGLAANCLKNKPWKVTHMTTDHTKFVGYLYVVWQRFMTFWYWTEADLTFMYQLYVMKNQVNQFRVNSKY